MGPRPYDYFVFRYMRFGYRKAFFEISTSAEIQYILTHVPRIGRYKFDTAHCEWADNLAIILLVAIRASAGE
jgi:hypothetical protein